MFELEFKKFKMNKIVKSRRGEAKMFEFEFKGLEMNKIGNLREGRPTCLNLNLQSSK